MDCTYNALLGILAGAGLLVFRVSTNPSIGAAGIDKKSIVSGRATDPDRGSISHSWDTYISTMTPEGETRSEPASVTSIVSPTAFRDRALTTSWLW
jgi:hypothetical protein